MISSTFFHQKKVQVLWSSQDSALQPAFWALGFQGPIDPQSGMIINLKMVMQIQEDFLKISPAIEPSEWLNQSRSFVQALPAARLAFVTSLFFPLMKVKLELHSESSRWVFERHHIFEVGLHVLEVWVRTDLQNWNKFRPATEESWPRQFQNQEDLEIFLAQKGEYLVKPYLKNEGFTSSNY